MRGNGKPVLVTNGLYADDAWRKSMQRCRSKHRVQCKEIVNFAACIAYAESNNRSHYTWGRNESLAHAKKDALAERRRISGRACDVTRSGCNKRS